MNLTATRWVEGALREGASECLEITSDISGEGSVPWRTDYAIIGGISSLQEHAMTRLRQKLIEDLKVRHYAPSTMRAYVRAVAAFATYHSRSPDHLGPEQIHHYQLHLVRERKLAPTTVAQIVSGPRFFYETTLGRKWVSDGIAYPRQERRLPTVLGRCEVAALLDAPRNLKHRVMLMALYGAGLRVSELVALQAADVDSRRKLIRVRQRQRPQRSRGSVARQTARGAAHLLEGFEAGCMAVSRRGSKASRHD